MTLGVIDGAPEQQFHRIFGGFLTDSSAIVLNRAAPIVREFAFSGRLLNAFGREGDGPGEFRRPRRAARWLGDTVVVWNSRRRISVLGSDRVARSVTYRPPPSHPELSEVEGLFPDGSVLARQVHLPRLPAAPQIVADTLAWMKVSVDGVIQDEVARARGSEFYTSGSARLDRPTYVSRPLGRNTSGHVTKSGRVLIADRSDHVIKQYSAGGRPLPDIVWNGTLNEVSEEAREFWDDVIEDYPGIEWPATLPSHRMLRVDADGRLWLQEYATGGPETYRWDVVDPNGGHVGWIELESRFRVLDAKGPQVLLRWQDELDVQHVEVRRLGRPSNNAVGL